MLDILRTVSDIVLPPSSDTLVVRELTEDNISCCYNFNQHENFASLSDYGDSHVKACVNANKFDNNTKASHLLGLLLRRYIKDAEVKDFVILPIPLSKRRQIKRGYNQVTRVAKLVAPGHINESVLRRQINTKPQTTLDKTKRYLNVKDAFVANVKAMENLPDLVIILDDVVTTGATMEAARATLAPHLKPQTTLICLALSH